MPQSFVQAAQYLRMSTDHQQYSLDNQAAAISGYAAEHGFSIVRTYSDAARSGVRIKNRNGLKQLLRDVVEGQTEFRAVLVYDVSRWGRFQDADEAAHYEYLCKSSGVPVHYCAEIFVNDDSMPHLIMKALKRTMAGEYSRELSVKIKAGLVRLARMGYKLGGHAPYGLSRLLLDASGKPKQLLMFGDRKNLANEHVIFVPGPENEVATVRRIFDEFANEQKGLAEIADGLNRDGITFWYGSKWNSSSVTRTLRHSAYAGKQVWGRTAAFLSGPIKRLPPEQWIVRLGAFESLISQELFDRAQQGFARFTRNQSDSELLARLRRLLNTHGKLTSRILEQSSGPRVTTYNRRFGSLLHAYERLGYRSPTETSVAFRVQAMLIRAELIRTVLQEFSGQLQEVRPNRRLRAILREKRNGLLIAVVIAKRRRTVHGADEWQLKPPSAERKRPTLVALLDENNEAIDRIVIFRHMRFPGKSIRFTDASEWFKTGIPLAQLSDLLFIVQRLRSDPKRAEGGKQKAA